MSAKPLPRYEFKYVLTASDIDYIRERTRVFMQRDPMGDDGSYYVYSLYFDTWDWQTAAEALEGLRHRFKLRLRMYDNPANEPVFAENKGRVGTSIVKSRAITTNAHAQMICRREIPPRASDDLMSFCITAQRLDMSPRLWVRYRREAWVSPWGCGSRLTFDSTLEAQLPGERDPMKPDKHGWHNVDIGGPALLELKFNGASPGWMQKIVHGAQLDRVSYSKYTTGAVRLWDRPWAAQERNMTWTP
jgi:hypothetical protein